MLINFDFDGVIADTFDQLVVLCTDAQEIVARGKGGDGRRFADP